MAVLIRRSLLRFGVVLACTTVASVSLAAPSAGERAQAEALFREARTLLSAGSVAEACGKLAESQRLDPQLGTQLNLALCHAKEGKTASAWIEFREVAERADTARDRERSEYARQQAEHLVKKLSRLRVLVDKGAASGMVVKLDGEALGASALGSAVPVDPGDHVIEATAPGKKAWTHKARLDAPGDVDVTVPRLEDAPAESVVAAPGATATTPKPETGLALQPARAERSPVLGYTVAGVGIVGIGIGAFFGLRTLSKKSDADAECPNDVCTSAGHDLEGEARTASIISTIGFGVGIVALAGGAFLILRARSSAGGKTAIRVLPTAGGARLEAVW